MTRLSRFRPAALALAALTLPGLALAGPYDGVYRQAANADCGLIGVDGGAISIEDGVFNGVEMECRMTRPVDVVNMDATLYTMECSGEDQIWSERTLLMNAAAEGGLIMLWNGYAFRYDRCPDGAAATDTTE